MPLTAEVMNTLPAGTLPEELTDETLARAIDALREDLPGSPIDYIEQIAPFSKQCECGAVHLRVNDPTLDAATYKSLLRLLATPFGDIVREHMRRRHEFSSIKFGWDGIGTTVPTFLAAVDHFDVRTVATDVIDDEVLIAVIEALREDMPKLLEMAEKAIATSSAYSVSAEPGEAGRDEWIALIDQVMFAFATPVRKYLVAWAQRLHGAELSAINCCIVMSDRVGNQTGWLRRRMTEQTDQQLTPDC